MPLSEAISLPHSGELCWQDGSVDTLDRCPGQRPGIPAVYLNVKQGTTSPTQPTAAVPFRPTPLAADASSPSRIWS
jgi:hypothetical protein